MPPALAVLNVPVGAKVKVPIPDTALVVPQTNVPFTITASAALPNGKFVLNDAVAPVLTLNVVLAVVPLELYVMFCVVDVFTKLIVVLAPVDVIKPVPVTFRLPLRSTDGPEPVNEPDDTDKAPTTVVVPDSVPVLGPDSVKLPYGTLLGIAWFDAPLNTTVLLGSRIPRVGNGAVTLVIVNVAFADTLTPEPAALINRLAAGTTKLIAVVPLPTTT